MPGTNDVECAHIQGGPVHLILVFPAAVLASLITIQAFAGSLCGTVRDGSTNQAVPRAGLFLRTPLGSYTGYNTATDNLGHYCFDGIPAGFYDLEVRVDNYSTAWVRNIEIEESVSGIDIDLPAAGFLLLPPFPNPAIHQVRIAFRLPESSPASVIVTDIQGRLVHGWESTMLPAGNHEFTWNFRDRLGRSVKSGRYFVRLEAGHVELIRSFVHLAR
jgi:hypothetical protein